MRITTTRPRLVVSVILLLISTASLDARETPQGQSVSVRDRLRGILAVQLLTAPADEADKQCGLTPESTRLAAVKAVEDSGLKVSENRVAPMLSLDFTTVHVPEFGLCVSNLRVVLSATVTGVPQSSAAYFPSAGSRIGQMEILSRHVMSWSAPANHGDRVRGRATELIGQILAEIKLANR